MQMQDKRSADQERCIGDMSEQLGKLAKAVETLCGALGPAVRDSVNGALGPQMSDLRDIAAETRRAASDLTAAAAVARAQPPPYAAYYASQLNSREPLGVPAGAAARRDAALMATALAPEIEHIVANAIEREMSLAEPLRDGSPPLSLDTRRRHGVTTAPKTTELRDARGALPRASVLRDSPRRASEWDEDRESDWRQRAREAHEAREREAQEKDEDARTREAREKGAEVREREASGSRERGAKTPAVNSRVMSEDETKKIHSAIRWNKPLGELTSLVTDAERANCEDPRNGNRPIHIAAQNGFTPICKLLVAKGAEIDAVNAKGNTGLHMARGYDYDECADFLVSCGADLMIENAEGHAAKNGLEGDKGPDGYVAPLAELRDARTPEESAAALKRIAKEGLVDADKAALVHCGLLKKKNLPESWPPDVQDAFKRLIMQM